MKSERFSGVRSEFGIFFGQFPQIGTISEKCELFSVRISGVCVFGFCFRDIDGSFSDAEYREFTF